MKTGTRKEPPAEMMELGKRLKKAIARSKINAAELARRSNTSPDQISRAISGETLAGIEAQTVAKWSIALGVRLDWLVLGIDPAAREKTIQIFHDGTAGVDIALDVIIDRMRERGMSVQIESVSADKNGDK